MSLIESDYSLEETLRQLAIDAPNYTPSDIAIDNLYSRNVNFVSVSAPFGVGKTTITDEVLRLDSDFTQLATTTNRARKEGDPANYRTSFPLDKLIEAIRNQEVINYDVILNLDSIQKSHIYATYPEGFQGPYTIGPYTTRSIPTFERIRQHVAGYLPVFITVDPDFWSQNIAHTLEERPDRVLDRVEEGTRSLSDARRHINDWFFVKNTPGQRGAEKAAQTIIAMARGLPYEKPSIEEIRQDIDAMLARLEEIGTAAIKNRLK